MLNLGASELAILRQFVKDVLQTIEYDDTGVTDELEDPAKTCAEILKMIYTGVDDEESS